jgi:hypothetical protein
VVTLGNQQGQVVPVTDAEIVLLDQGVQAYVDSVQALIIFSSTQAFRQYRDATKKLNAIHSLADEHKRSYNDYDYRMRRLSAEVGSSAMANITFEGRMYRERLNSAREKWEAYESQAATIRRSLISGPLTMLHDLASGHTAHTLLPTKAQVHKVGADGSLKVTLKPGRFLLAARAKPAIEDNADFRYWFVWLDPRMSQTPLVP